MQKPPSPHRWGLAHSFRSEREEGGANGVQGTAEGIPRAVRRRAPPQPLSPGAVPALASLTHARAPSGAHVQAVAAVAVAVVRTSGVHADAPASAARFSLALVHV